MILIDTNALIVLILGLINPNLVDSHPRTSIYVKQDFHDLLLRINDLDRLIVLPNVWTEVDNLLNDFRGNRKYRYVKTITEAIKASTEQYIESVKAIENSTFYDLGLTDSLLLEKAKSCTLLITSDSTLSDYAIANGISVYDMVKIRNEKIK